jgi:uncharacterized protein YerC
MNTKENNLMQEYVKKRFDDAEKDYKTFDITAVVDNTLTYSENLSIINEKLNILLHKDDKKPSIMPKEQLELVRKLEQDKQEAEIKARLDKEIENITKDSKQLEKLYYIPIKYIEMVATGNQRGLLLYGESSLGKSFRVKEVLKRLGKKDYLFVAGHITPMKFYEKLFMARDKLIIFDDCNILENIIVLNMIKACLNENSGNVVEYHTTKKMDIPSSFIFSGQVIILLNEIPKRNEHLRAIESRVLKYHLKFTREEILKIIFEIATKKEIEGTTLAQRLEVARWIKDNTNKATRNLNIRLYLQAIDFYKWNKDNWQDLISKQIENDEYVTLIVQGCSNEEWTEKTGYSRATMMRLKKEMGLTRAYGVING